MSLNRDLFRCESSKSICQCQTCNMPNYGGIVPFNAFTMRHTYCKWVSHYLVSYNLILKILNSIWFSMNQKKSIGLIFDWNYSVSTFQLNINHLCRRSTYFIFSSSERETRSSGGRHRFAFMWLVESMIGMIGMILNCYVLHIFYSERQYLHTSVNAMTR